MKRYIYNYQTITTFSKPIDMHSFLLRCQPAINERQKIENEHVIISPDYWTESGVDAFGNKIIFGGTTKPQNTFAYVSTGLVNIKDEATEQDEKNLHIYTLQSRLTWLNEDMIDLARSLEHFHLDMAEHICSLVHEMLHYVPNTTNVDTPAWEVLQKKRGVCQDFAHLMIALCRAKGIPARYVNGFLTGTGQTHAWVEVFDGKNWLGYDPTHNCDTRQGYVKLSHGRDYADCPVCRGIFRGNVLQQTLINVTLHEL
ncbi:MAG: transglutaminase family protein [Bacteroidaceae bacterium]|nr:transglutaminase family protein [Bacteroidaceae bacterium]